MEADEVTYNLHIVLRFELEVALFGGELELADLPEAWRERTVALLGVELPDDAEGVLQDVHWAARVVRLLPHVLARQRDRRPALGAALASCRTSTTSSPRGDLEPLRECLRDRLYRHGRKHLPGEMIAVTGGAARPRAAAGPAAGEVRRALRAREQAVDVSRRTASEWTDDRLSDRQGDGLDRRPRLQPARLLGQAQALVGRPDAALSGWSVLVTGANSGIGAAACERFARAGADVHMLVRDRERGEDARARISEQTGSDRLQLEVCDVSSLESVREFAADFLRPRERAPRARQQRRRDAARADADRAKGSS